VRMQWRTLNSSRSVASNMATISSSAMAFSSGSDFRPGRTSALCGFPHNPVQSQNSVHGLARFMHDLHAVVLHAPPALEPCAWQEQPGTLLLLEPVRLRVFSPDSAASAAAPFRSARCWDSLAEPRCGLWPLPTTAAIGFPYASLSLRECTISRHSKCKFFVIRWRSPGVAGSGAPVFCFRNFGIPNCSQLYIAASVALRINDCACS